MKVVLSVKKINVMFVSMCVNLIEALIMIPGWIKCFDRYSRRTHLCPEIGLLLAGTVSALS